MLSITTVVAFGEHVRSVFPGDGDRAPKDVLRLCGKGDEGTEFEWRIIRSGRGTAENCRVGLLPKSLLVAIITESRSSAACRVRNGE